MGSGSDNCTNCGDNRINSVFDNCLHGCVCMDCAFSLLIKAKRCPICNNHVYRLMMIDVEDGDGNNPNIY